MGTAAKTDRSFTVEEFLALERNAAYKSEWIDGAIVAMSGGTPDHALIGANLIRELGVALGDGPCAVYTSDLLVGVRLGPPGSPFAFPIEPERGLYSHPDLTVVCGDLAFHDEKRDVVTNPTLVVEVLSPSTEPRDRDWKLPRYQAVPSLREILFVHPDRTEVEHHHRAGAGDWSVSIVAGPDESLELASLGVTLALARIYRRVSLGAP